MMVVSEDGGGRICQDQRTICRCKVIDTYSRYITFLIGYYSIIIFFMHNFGTNIRVGYQLECITISTYTDTSPLEVPSGLQLGQMIYVLSQN